MCTSIHFSQLALGQPPMQRSKERKIRELEFIEDLSRINFVFIVRHTGLFFFSLTGDLKLQKKQSLQVMATWTGEAKEDLQGNQNSLQFLPKEHH